MTYYTSYLFIPLFFLLLITSISSAIARAGDESTTGATAKTTSKSPVNSIKALTDTEIKAKKKAADDALTAYKVAKAADRLTKLNELGNKLIDHRIASLNQFMANLAKRKHLTEAQVSALDSDVEQTIDALGAIKVKLAAATTVDEAKTEIHRIFQDYHVYAVLMPKLHLTVVIDQSKAILDQTLDLTPRLQMAVDKVKETGGDTSALQTSLVDFSSQLKDARKQLDAAKSEVAKIKLGDKEASSQAISAAKEAIQKFRAAIVAARGDLTTFRSGLDSANSASSSSDKSVSDKASSTTSPTNETPSTKPPKSSSRVIE